MNQLKDLLTDVLNRNTVNPEKPQSNGIEIYFLRHGQTNYNLKGIVQGQEVDEPLNGTGENQALMTGNHLKKTVQSFDSVYCSPLLRAKKTAQIINSIMEYRGSITYDDRLMERKAGIFSGKTEEEINQLIEDDKDLSDIVKKYKRGEIPFDEYDIEYSKLSNGETKQDAALRATDFIVSLMSQLERVNESKPNKILVVAHGSLIKSMLRKMFSGVHFKMANCCINVLQYRDSKFELQTHSYDDHLQ